MALILFLLIGSLFGWLASILSRTEDRNGILKDVGVGLVGAIVAGILANSGSIIGGANVLAVIAAMAGAALLLTAYEFGLKRSRAN